MSAVDARCLALVHLRQLLVNPPGFHGLRRSGKEPLALAAVGKEPQPGFEYLNHKPSPILIRRSLPFVSCQEKIFTMIQERTEGAAKEILHRSKGLVP
ncbi:hypothetical protein [Rhizorhabdus dicambivorans]|uniref:hypothetical protein n=1 Tax=Rhizorhabdus dicambivorans TaxID=1850238 RepID=UPI0015969B07|nr:hypothetical protein [Rhizorhabdus dicambivorans]